jgi:uncharacterized Zn finger protein
VAFEGLPSLDLYKTLQRLSGSGWEGLKTELISFLQGTAYLDVLADVYLEEQDWDAACQLADTKSWDYRLLEKVAEAVIPHRPEWVIQVSLKQSDELIARTQSKYYPAAARWLQRAKRAFLQLGQREEWQSYLAALRAQYNRRPALQNELRRL